MREEIKTALLGNLIAKCLPEGRNSRVVDVLIFPLMLALKKKKILGLQSRVPYVLARKTGKPAVIWKCDFIHVVKSWKKKLA